MRFAASMFDRYRGVLSTIEDFSSLDRWMSSIDMEAHFLEYAARTENLRPAPGEWGKTVSYMMPQIKALVGRYSVLDDEAFYRFYLPVDETIQVALKNSSVVE